MPRDRPRVPHDVIFFDFWLFLNGLEPYFFTFFLSISVCGVGVVLYGVGVGVWCCVVLVCGVVWCWCVVLYGVGSGAKRGGGVGRRHWVYIPIKSYTFL